MNKVETVVGEFSANIEVLSEENLSDHISYKNKTLNYRLSVYSGEGPIPHFHLKDTTNGRKGADICICIFAPMYFVHGNHTDTLTTNELKILNKFLSTKCDIADTYWEAIVFLWDKNNPDNEKRYPQFRYNPKKQPNYENTMGFASNHPIY